MVPPVPVWVLLGTVLWTALFYALTFLVVRHHYAVSLPHFDSMGSFTLVWQMMNAVEMSGYRAGLKEMAEQSPGWIQPLFGILVAGLPFRTPEAVILINFGLLLLTQLAMLNYGRVFGFSPARQLVMVTLPALPAVESAWQGGFQDFRRDSQLLVLVTGLLFQSLAYTERPGWRNGLALGLLGGLTLWSRDNSAFMVAIITLPAVAITVWRGYAEGGVWEVIRRARVPVSAFLAMLVPYYVWTLGLTWVRYTTNVWGFGRDRLLSLLTAWDAPWQVMVGGRFASTTGASAVATGAVLAMLAVGVGLGWRRGMLALCPGRLLTRPYALPLISGMVVATVIVMFYALGVGITGAQSGIVYLPSVAPVVAMLVGLLGLVTRTPTTPRAASYGLSVFACTAILALAVARMLLNDAPPYGEANVAAFRQLALRLGQQATGHTVAVLWTEDFSRHHLDYYLTQAGYPRILDFATRATERGYRIDLDQPLRPGDQPAVLQERLDAALHTYAAYVVVCLDVAEYEDSERTRLWPYLVGRPVIEHLMADPSFVLVEQFAIRGRPFAILKNLHPSPDALPRTVRAAAREPSPGGGAGVRPAGVAPLNRG